MFWVKINFISKTGQNAVQDAHLTLPDDLKDQMTSKLPANDLIRKNTS